jgi:hypothetical protein
MSARKKTASANPPASLSEELQECFRILKAIEEKSDAGPFMEPVDWQSLGLLDYPQIIKTPMDLGTVEVSVRRAQARPGRGALSLTPRAP